MVVHYLEVRPEPLVQLFRFKPNVSVATNPTSLLTCTDASLINMFLFLFRLQEETSLRNSTVQGGLTNSFLECCRFK